MPISVEDVIEIMIDNTKKRGSPVPISKGATCGWAEPLSIPKGGPRILYTGLLYQLIPSIDALVKYLAVVERGKGLLLKVGKVISKVIDISKFVKVSGDEVNRANKTLRNIAGLLDKAGVKFGYLYDKEMYSGALLYDLGIDDLFKEHIAKVYRTFLEHNVEEVITIDPHTTHMLRTIYPEYIDGFKIKVRNYLEVLMESGLKPITSVSEKVTLHDPCVYARYLDIINEPRELLKRGGVNINEVRRSGKLTYCCGGPVESISPTLCSEVAKSRLEELAGASEKIITMCPICYSSLSRVANGNVVIADISDYLAKIYLGK